MGWVKCSDWGMLKDVMVLAFSVAVWVLGMGLLAVAVVRQRAWDPQVPESLAHYLAAAVESPQGHGPDPLVLEAVTAAVLAPVAPAPARRPVAA